MRTSSSPAAIVAADCGSATSMILGSRGMRPRGSVRHTLSG
jgi:hypothetical protein